MKQLSKGEVVAVFAVFLLACIAIYISHRCISNAACSVIERIIEDAKKREECKACKDQKKTQKVRIEVPIDTEAFMREG